MHYCPIAVVLSVIWVHLAGLPKMLSGSLLGQNYFRNSKALFAYFSSHFLTST